MTGVTILQGDVREVLPTLPEESVHCVVTSPPYWGLRDYGCEGQLGLERTPEEYIANMVAVFREVRRVLRGDGTLWLNMGDSYAGGGCGSRDPERWPTQSRNDHMETHAKDCSNLKPKDLCGIPWMLAFALRADGWYLRQDIIWSKPNPMPESVTDRCTKAHEYIFLLSKSERYFYDADAIKEAAICGDPRKPYAPGQVDNRGDGHDRGGGKIRESVKRGGFNGKTNELAGREAFRAIEDFRNKRSVWTVATQPFPEAHFATFPEDLIKPCILAGAPEKCCAECGAPWERVTATGELTSTDGTKETFRPTKATDDPKIKARSEGWTPNHYRPKETIGFEPTCKCGTTAMTPGTVLDCFGGSGTTALVARANGCKAILIELSADYIKIAEKRLRQEVLAFA